MKMVLPSRGLPSGSAVKYLPAKQEKWVRSQGQEDPLDKAMAPTHSSILAWEIPWTEEPGGLQSIGLQKSQTQLKRLNNNNMLSSAEYMLNIIIIVLYSLSLLTFFPQNYVSNAIN